MNEEGMVEVDKGSFSIEPFLYAAGRLITWADVDLSQALTKGYLPIPSSEWRSEGLAMKITAFAVSEDAGPVLILRYRVVNTAQARQVFRFFAALRPFQVTPTWQEWQSFGGVSPVRDLSFRNGAVWVNGKKAVIPMTPPAGFGGAPFAGGGIMNYLAMGELPSETQVTDDFGYAFRGVAI